VVAHLGGLKSAVKEVARVPAGLEQVKAVQQHEAHQKGKAQAQEQFRVETFVHEVARIDRAGSSFIIYHTISDDTGNAVAPLASNPSGSGMSSSEPAREKGPPSAEELLRRLTGTLAHNLNNRLTVVVGSLELALQEVAADTALAERLKAGLMAGLQSAEMVRRMVAFAYRPGGPPDTWLVSLGEVAENAAGRLRERQPAGLAVEVVHSTATPARANPLMVQLALEQLVTNAVEAMPAGGVLTLEVRDNSGGVCLEVRDTGPGLSDLAAAHLFEPFVTTHSAGHLGLGLVLCRDLARALGGGLSLTWQASKGTTATLSLPAGPTQAPADVHPVPPQEPPPPGALWHVI
jgi:signal transduction histidine kinase